MAKLRLPETAGYNAGEKYAKTMLIKDIVIQPEIAGIFTVDEKIVNEIKENILVNDYDKSQPVVIWKGKNILVDGRTRLTAATAAGLTEILVTEKEFDSLEDAMFYTLERQFIRRNLTSEQLLDIVALMPEEKGKKGEMGSAASLAKRLGLSRSQVFNAIDVLKNSPQEDIEAVKRGDMSIKTASAMNRQRRAEAKKEELENDTLETDQLEPNTSETDELEPDTSEQVENDALELNPYNYEYRFLKSAVILLVESGQEPAAQTLVNHFLRKNERNDFYKYLPEQIRGQLK